MLSQVGAEIHLSETRAEAKVSSTQEAWETRHNDEGEVIRGMELYLLLVETEWWSVGLKEKRG